LQAIFGCNQAQMAPTRVQMAPEAAPVLNHSSFWKLLWTWNEFSSLCIVFKNLLRTIDFNHHILDSSCDVLICRFIWFLTTKHSKYLWSCKIYDKSELQRLEWKQYHMFLKPLTTPLSLNLFIFKCNEKY